MSVSTQAVRFFQLALFGSLPWLCWVMLLAAPAQNRSQAEMSQKQVQLFHQGRYRLETEAREMRMSHWLYAPLLRNETGEILLDLSESIWDLRGARETEHGILLSLARYPDGARLYSVELLLFEGQARLLGKTFPLDQLTKNLQAIK